MSRIQCIINDLLQKYKLDMSSGSNFHQLNLALTRGAKKRDVQELVRNFC